MLVSKKIPTEFPRCRACNAIINPRWGECISCGQTHTAKPIKAHENVDAPTCMFCRKPVQRGTPGTGALAGKDLHMDCYIRSEKQEEGKSLLVEVPPLPEPTRCKEWDASTHDIIDWFLKTVPPTEPFELSQGVTIADPALWWATIRGDIAAGPKGPRAHYGALQGDLRRLAGLLQPDIIEREERAAIKAEGACPNDVIDPLKKELNDLPHENPKNKSPPWD